MASWHELPYPVSSRIFGFLPTRDVVNVARVCVNWKLAAVTFLEAVKIDESTPYGGSFYEYNAFVRRISNNEKPLKSLDLKHFVDDLAECTDGIKYLDIEVDHIPDECIAKLLISQKGIKRLMLRVRNKWTRGPPVEDCDKEVVKGMIKHESTLEKLSIRIQGQFIRFRDLANHLKDKKSCFGNLKSIEFLSTSAGNYGVLSREYNNIPEGEEKNALEVFEKMFTNSKVEELNFKPLLPLDACDGSPEVYWHPTYIKLLIQYFHKGAFSNLKKINIDSLNTGGTNWEFSETEAELLIKYCPLISHVDSNVSRYEINQYYDPSYNDKPLIRLINHYGTQLEYLNLSFMTANIAKCVYENCPNVKSITIFDAYKVSLTDEALMLLAELQHLRSLTLIIESTSVKKETMLKFLAKVILQLKNLIVCYQDYATFDANIIQVISQHGCNLKKLHLEFNFSFTEAEFKSVMDCFLDVLEGCQKLQKLAFTASDTLYRQDLLSNKIRVSKEISDAYMKSMTEALITKQKQLKFAWIHVEGNLTDKYKEQLIYEMPQCEFYFECAD